MNQNNNNNNIVGYDPMTGQPIYTNQNMNVQQSVPQEASVQTQPVTPTQQPVQMQQPGVFPGQQQVVQINNVPVQNPNLEKKSKTKLFIIIGAVVLLVIVAIILVPKLLGSGSGGSSTDKNKPVEVFSTWEEVDGGYVLKDQNGNILLDNIKSHGEFCNGTTEVENNDGQYSIVDGTGKLLVEFGKYKYLDQVSSWGGNYYCFYEVTQNEPYQKFILKYDGSIFYSSEEDKYLKDVDINVYDTTVKFVVFETETNFQLVDFKGNVFATIEKVEDEDITVLSATGDEVYDSYLTIYYNNKSYIYDLNTFKEKYTYDGKFGIDDFEVSEVTVTIAGIENTTKEEILIISGEPDPTNKDYNVTYVYLDDKLKFQTDKCLRANVTNINDIQCLIQNGGVYEYYDINGNKIEEE